MLADDEQVRIDCRLVVCAFHIFESVARLRSEVRQQEVQIAVLLQRPAKGFLPQLKWGIPTEERLKPHACLLCVHRILRVVQHIRMVSRQGLLLVRCQSLPA